MRVILYLVNGCVYSSSDKGIFFSTIKKHSMNLWGGGRNQFKRETNSHYSMKEAKLKTSYKALLQS